MSILHATATFEIVSWEEESGHDVPEVGQEEAIGAPRVTRARVTKRFTGDLCGEGIVHYILMHRGDGTARFVGFERVTGTLGDRQGSFVLEHAGTFEGGASRTRWTVASGSGTGELRGLRGKGGSASAHAKAYPMMLEYEVV